MNYYNEFDPKAAAWLKQLIQDKQIPDGHVDSRSIIEVVPADLAGFTQCHFFAGIGGWSYALHLAGAPSTEKLWTASLPCQPFSVAGAQRGTEDERHLAPVFLELVRQCRPAKCFGEQVASKLARTDWLPGIRLELEALGYRFGSADLCSPCAGEIGEGRIVRGDQESWERVIIGHPHIRQRLYWVADRRVADTECHEEYQEQRGPSEAKGGRCSDITGRCSVAVPTDDRLAHTNRISELRDSRCGDEGTGPCGEPLGRGLLKTGGDGAYPDLGIPHSSSTGLERRGSPVGVEKWTNGQAHSYGSHILLPCRDGKTRRTESGIFPLVDGIPRGVVPSGDPNDPCYANATSEARAARLKGYGNAIDPTLASLFIKSYMEATNQ